ncbi:putative blastopia polyprotein [Trichonephila clavipes]|nr:putative blastopia polyprotein [Trichonephila clavipes]
MNFPPTLILSEAVTLTTHPYYLILTNQKTLSPIKALPQSGHLHLLSRYGMNERSAFHFPTTFSFRLLPQPFEPLLPEERYETLYKHQADKYALDLRIVCGRLWVAKIQRVKTGGPRTLQRRNRQRKPQRRNRQRKPQRRNRQRKPQRRNHQRKCKTKKSKSSGRNANKTSDSDENEAIAKEKNDLLKHIDFLNSIILDTKLKEPNKSKAHFVKKRKQHIYKKDEPVTIKRTQFRIRLKLRPNFYGPYLIKTVKPHDRNEVKNVGQHEGPHLTSTAVDFMKRWSTADA